MIAESTLLGFARDGFRFAEFNSCIGDLRLDLFQTSPRLYVVMIDHKLAHRSALTRFEFADASNDLRSALFALYDFRAFDPSLAVPFVIGVRGWRLIGNQVARLDLNALREVVHWPDVWSVTFRRIRPDDPLRASIRNADRVTGEDTGLLVVEVNLDHFLMNSIFTLMGSFQTSSLIAEASFFTPIS